MLFLALGETAPAERIGAGELRFIAHPSDRQVVASYYQAADVYVHGAKAEAWGLTITEAMACGLPVVASDVGGIPDQVAEGQTGFLVPVGDADSMAERLGRLLADPTFRQAMGQRLSARAREEFGLLRMASNYLQWYESIVAEKSELHG